MSHASHIKQSEHFYKRRLLLFAVVVVLALLFWYSQSLQKFLLDTGGIFQSFVTDHQFLGSLFFILVAALSAMLSPFSSLPLVPIVVLVFGNLFSIVLLLAGWLMGSAASYFIGAYARHLIEPRTLSKIEHYKEKVTPRSQFEIILLFKLALPSEITGYTLGIIKYGFSKYLLASLLAEMPFAVVTVYLSNALIQKDFTFFAALVSSALIVTFIFFVFVRRLNKKDGVI